MKLRFTVHKHNARHLHYDFRLEMLGTDGASHVLKSWAVPKGPSMDPSDKRLAVLVEDHEMSYLEFEGSIPEGDYGAGNVIVWDTGEYKPFKYSSYISLEKFRDYFDKGTIEFELEGKKLIGKFALVRLKAQKKNWLLIKMKDEFASSEDILKHGKSVVSGKTLENINN